MRMHRVTAEMLKNYKRELVRQERSPATIQKYWHDLQYFVSWLDEQRQGRLTKEAAVAYKAALTAHYAAASVNSMLAAFNGFLAYMGWNECRVKLLKIQCGAYMDQEQELSEEEYRRLLHAAQAKGDQRLFYLLQTICATGIRVSELPFITVEAVSKGTATVRNKGKCRMVFLPKRLCAQLRQYCMGQKIRRGSIFVTRSGRPLNRSNIWTMMKALCEAANVARCKVFPHNLRHLFARTFYKKERDLDHLADLLGHSSINTTRIYTKTTSAEYLRQIELLQLVL